MLMGGLVGGALFGKREFFRAEQERALEGVF